MEGLLHPSLWKACPVTATRRSRPWSEQPRWDRSFHSVRLGSPNSPPQAYRTLCLWLGWRLVTSPERRHSRPKNLPRPQQRRHALATCDLLFASTNRWGAFAHLPPLATSDLSTWKSARAASRRRTSSGEALHRHGASFETAASQPPQDEVSSVHGIILRCHEGFFQRSVAPDPLPPEAKASGFLLLKGGGEEELP
jgi:hypothetical protein